MYARKYFTSWRVRREDRPRSLDEAIRGFKELIFPLLDADNSLDRSIMATIDLGARNLVGRARKVRAPAMEAVAEVEAATASRIAPSGVEREVDALLRRLAVAEEQRSLAEQKADIVHQRLAQAEAATLAAEQELAITRTVLKDLARVPQEAMKLHERLPEEVRRIIGAGHVHDWKTINGPGLRHIRLTVKEDGSEPVTAQEVMEQAVGLDFVQIAAVMLVRNLQENNWDIEAAARELPSKFRTLSEQMTQAVRWLENAQSGTIPDGSGGE
ncbi:hypothetical protein ACIBEJ_48840 [Nonomuraea sp. NPDC050790]|uniref:hypothetical protein n=1 Tax=Nonomuraea sp. NPDC050790 TaxID=3364371 RepID=UPI0037BD3487